MASAMQGQGPLPQVLLAHHPPARGRCKTIIQAAVTGLLLQPPTEEIRVAPSLVMRSGACVRAQAVLERRAFELPPPEHAECLRGGAPTAMKGGRPGRRAAARA